VTLTPHPLLMPWS